MSSLTQICRLCQNVVSLRNSHVIPEFCFKPTYDSNHRALEINLSAERKRYIQKGYREYLFCEDCEQLFGRLENYFATEWYKNGKLPQLVEEDLLEIHGLDYTKFKLFHHSILFRASVSTLRQFKFVNLGENEEIFREMLLAGDARDEHEFPFMTRILFHPEDQRVASDIIVEPEMSRPNGRYCYVFVFGGCSWFYYASKTQSLSLMPHVFSQAGSLYLVAECIYDNPRIRELVKGYRAMNERDV